MYLCIYFLILITIIFNNNYTTITQLNTLLNIIWMTTIISTYLITLIEITKNNKTWYNLSTIHLFIILNIKMLTFWTKNILPLITTSILLLWLNDININSELIIKLVNTSVITYILSVICLTSLKDYANKTKYSEQSKRYYKTYVNNIYIIINIILIIPIILIKDISIYTTWKIILLYLIINSILFMNQNNKQY